MEKTAAQEMAKKIRKIANEPKAKRLLLVLPGNDLGLPIEEFILGPFLRLIAAALEGRL